MMLSAPPFACAFKIAITLLRWPWLLRNRKENWECAFLGKQSALTFRKHTSNFCVSERDRSLSVIVIFNEKGAATWYVANALMFGASASVFSFNRISRALHFLFTKVLNVVCSYFYDDYPMLARADTAAETDRACGRLLDLLGIRFARNRGPIQKGNPSRMSSTFWGLVFRLTGLHLGKLVLANKPGRIERLIELFSQARKDGNHYQAYGASPSGPAAFCRGLLCWHVLAACVCRLEPDDTC